MPTSRAQLDQHFDAITEIFDAQLTAQTPAIGSACTIVSNATGQVVRRGYVFDIDSDDSHEYALVGSLTQPAVRLTDCTVAVYARPISIYTADKGDLIWLGGTAMPVAEAQVLEVGKTKLTLLIDGEHYDTFASSLDAIDATATTAVVPGAQIPVDTPQRREADHVLHNSKMDAAWRQIGDAAIPGITAELAEALTTIKPTKLTDLAAAIKLGTGQAMVDNLPQQYAYTRALGFPNTRAGEVARTVTGATRGMVLYREQTAEMLHALAPSEHESMLRAVYGDGNEEAARERFLVLASDPNGDEASREFAATLWQTMLDAAPRHTGTRDATMDNAKALLNLVTNTTTAAPTAVEIDGEHYPIIEVEPLAREQKVTIDVDGEAHPFYASALVALGGRWIN